MSKTTIIEKEKKVSYANLTEKEKLIFNSADMSEVIYLEAIVSLGRDVSPTTGEFGCAESVNTVVKRAIGRPIGGTTSTALMYKRLLSDTTRFLSVKEKDIKRGDIIISPTGTAIKKSKIKCGHVGIVSHEDKVMSNSSATSLWKSNYTIQSWKDRWGKATYPVLFFRILQ